MSFLSSDEIHQLLNSLGAEYDQLNENRIKLENDCTKLREYIDSQIQQIQILNQDFEKLRVEFIQRKDEFGPRAVPETPQAPQPIEQPAPPQEEQENQEYTIQPLPGAENCQLNIVLYCEIVDVSVICSTTFSPDGTCLAIGSNSFIRVYSIDKDNFILQPKVEGLPNKETNYIRTIAWTPDSKRMLCGSEDAKIRIYEVDTNAEPPSEGSPIPQPAPQPIKTIDIFKDDVFFIQCSSDGRYFATATGEGSLTLFDLNTYAKIHQFPREATSPQIKATSLTIFNDNKLIAVSYIPQNDVWIFDVEARKVVCKQQCHSDAIYAIKFVPNSNRLITSSLDSKIKIWDMEWVDGNIKLNLWKTLDKHTDFIVSLDVDETGKYLLSGSKDLTTKLSDLQSGEMIYTIKAHSNSIMAVNFNPERSLFCTGSGDKTVKIWSFSPVEQ